MRTRHAACILSMIFCLCVFLASGATAHGAAASAAPQSASRAPVPSRPPESLEALPDSTVASPAVNDLTGVFTREKSSATLGKLPNLATLRQRKKGGLGTGVGYKNGMIEVSGWAELHEEMYIHPEGLVPAGPLTWLFTTATNRTEKTVEVVGIYYAENPGDFGIFDWSCSESDPCPNGETGPTWQWTKPLTEYPCNTTRVVNQAGHVHDMLYYTNMSVKLDEADPPTWQNVVYLWNYCTSSWDLVYQHIFHTVQKDCSLDGSCGWWGPILETFDDAEPQIKSLGFQSTYLLHDGTWSSLSPDETDFTQPGPPWKLFFLDPNKGYEAGNFVSTAILSGALSLFLCE